MQANFQEYDVVVVGASVAGSSAAILFAQKGLRVALVERSRDIDAFKQACTHYIQSFAMPIMERLGIAAEIEAEGGVANGGRAWTPYGWFGPGVNPADHGYNVRRKVLDPLLRRRAAELPNVDLFLGTAVREVLQMNGRVAGIRANAPGKQVVELRARLVVGADGRYSRTAKLAGVPQREEMNGRFIYFAYYRNLPLATGSGGQVWYNGLQAAYALPNDNNLTLLAAMLPKSQLAHFKRDIEGSFNRFFAQLPNAPRPQSAERASEFFGMLDMPLVWREASQPGLALVGDAAVAGDPVWGNGMGWAFSAAGWLADSVGSALQTGSSAAVDAALVEYREKVAGRLAGRFERDVDFARARPFNWLERLFYAAAVRDPRMGAYTGPQSTRLRNIRHMPPMKAILQAAWLILTRRSGENVWHLPESLYAPHPRFAGEAGLG